MITTPLDQTPLLQSESSDKEFLSKYQLSLPSAITSLSSHDENNPLVDGYQPTDLDVVCGRGKGSYNKPGNKRFRAIVKDHIPEYVAARTKFDKSTLLQKIIDTIREEARFIKQGKDGSWYEISDDAAREKVGHTIREAIAALEAAPGKSKTKKVFDNKQNDLLSQQKEIFNSMVRKPSIVTGSGNGSSKDRGKTPIPLSTPLYQYLSYPTDTDRDWKDSLGLADNIDYVGV